MIPAGRRPPSARRLGVTQRASHRRRSPATQLEPNPVPANTTDQACDALMGTEEPNQVASELVSQQPRLSRAVAKPAVGLQRGTGSAPPFYKRGSRNERPKGSGPTRFGSRVGHPRNADRKIRGSAMDRQHHYEPNDAYPGVVVPGRFGDRCRHSRFAVAPRTMALRPHFGD